MMAWLDIVILIAVTVGLVFALRAIRRRRKCSAGCSSCPLSESCNKPMKNKE